MKSLFIFAHPDDEAFGPAATIAKFASQGDATVVSLCNGNRPGSKSNVAKQRAAAFQKSTAKLGANHKIYSTDDTCLEFDSTLATIENIIDFIRPEIVVTHNASDLHRDHRCVAEAVLVACRPKPASSVNALLACELPASTEWAFGQLGPVFLPNVFVDATGYMNLKKEVMKLYSTELYKYPDARSVEGMEALAMHRGKQAGLQYAEGLQLLFARDHITL